MQALALCVGALEVVYALFVVLVDLLVDLDALFCLTDHLLQQRLFFYHFLELGLPRGQI